MPVMRCGVEYVCEYVEPTEHDFDDWRIISTPTAGRPGEKRHTCRICDEQETETFGLSTNGQEFADAFNLINLTDDAVDPSDFDGICRAVARYSKLSDEEKEWLSEDYKTLVSYARQYNEIAEDVNEDVDNATKNLFPFLALFSAILSAVLFALKNLF